ncbi:MAG TPA: Gfo/Idh/MocA family oxidoreductase [Anaerohalosphaeraceae bacterium]|jgi:predicted dehydrogenase|nr:Gfo/Idh/MocA family oxidoreductase [Anaerohalosphaeraceae bacterium]HRT50550.1 Gfo/Idh/MocA family oxidoreductase [Anaerohalosphaeraceae bacterium]HRT86510.1 Gfo/Idh/MocA family oxidoreductase [Anaerohalosphaeraceae bacterium]
MKQNHTNNKGQTRRDFMKTAAVSLAAAGIGAHGVFAAGPERFRVGLIGCGGRGTGAAIDCLNADGAVEIVAMGDLFEDRLKNAAAAIRNKFPDRFKVQPETMFTGFDCNRKVCAVADVNLVISATPPGFRPLDLKAAVEAGKHVFMEKPAATCPAGIRSVIASSELAEQKGLAIVAGTQRRHQRHYIELMKRIRDGAIGEIKAAQAFWNGGDMIGYWKWWEKGNMPGMEWQCRSWPWFVWTSGDHIVEQHVHNLDVVNWALGSHPVSAVGMGGRQVRTQGNIWDHFAVEYEYPNGVRVLSMCRQINGCTDNVSEHIVGAIGTCYTDSGGGRIYGTNAYDYKGPNPNPYVEEHKNLIASIRNGKPLNEGKQVAESTMTAILGRMSAYTGRAMKWDWAMKASKLDLTPERYDLAYDMPMAPVAMPGQTPLI